MIRRVDWVRVTAYGLLPGLALLLALTAGAFRYADGSVRESADARTQSVAAAKASTVAILSYSPDTVDRQLHDASGRLTGGFLKLYTNLIDDVVIPAAKQKSVTAVATVPAAGVISARPDHTVLMVYVDQKVTVGADAPTDNVSSVRVTMDLVDGRWLISAFEPVRA